MQEMSLVVAPNDDGLPIRRLAMERLQKLFTWGDLSEAEYHRLKAALLA